MQKNNFAITLLEKSHQVALLLTAGVVAALVVGHAISFSASLLGLPDPFTVEQAKAIQFTAPPGFPCHAQKGNPCFDSYEYETSPEEAVGIIWQVTHFWFTK